MPVTVNLDILFDSPEHKKISEVFYDTPYEEDDNDSINVSHNGENL